jgi:thiamine biosynthesis lipoprotein
MGTYVSFTVYDENKEETIEKGFNRVEEIENLFSPEIADSEISQINKNAGEQPVEVSVETYELLKLAHEYSSIKESGFDYTIGALTNLWRIGFDDARKPSDEEIQEVLPLVDYQKVKFDDNTQSVYLTEPGMRIDLGAIAKGYIADEVRNIFEEDGVTTAIIDLGGNVVTIGGSPSRDGEFWNVGIQDPMDDRGKTMGVTQQSDNSIVTSGVYERYLETDNGEIYHHLLDPETGYPIENGLISVSIVTERSVDADALATVIYGLGLETGLDFINDRDGVEAILVTEEKDVYTSDGLNDNFELTEESYSWVNQ